MNLERRKVADSKSGDDVKNVKNLDTEVNQNPLLIIRFSSMSLTLFAEVFKAMINISESKEVVTEFSEVAVQHRKMKITDLEFEEFAKLYFKICSPYLPR